MVRRTKEHAEVTRSQLLDAAEQVFAEKGVSHTSLADIAAAAGVTRGAIYWHFKNKADLFHAMMERVKMPIEEMADTMRLERSDDAIACLRTVGLSVLQHVATNSQTHRVFDIFNNKCELVGEMAIGRERELERRCECLTDIEQTMRNAVEQGTLPRSLDPRTAAIGWYSFISGLVINWVLHPASFDLAVEAPKLIDLYIKGLQAS